MWQYAVKIVYLFSEVLILIGRNLKHNLFFHAFAIVSFSLILIFWKAESRIHWGSFE